MSSCCFLSCYENDIQLDVPPQRESLPAVTAAAIVAILFSAFGVLCGMLVELSMLVIPDAAGPAARPTVPLFARTMAGLVWLFLLAAAAFGIFVGIGVLRRRNWARISMLVGGGLMAVFSAISIPFVFLVFKMLPGTLPNDTNAAPVLTYMKWFFVFFYGIPLCVGTWWLVLFTRKRVAEAFTIPLDSSRLSPSIDASGFPQIETIAVALRKPSPACPLPLAILSVFLIFSAVCMLLFLLVPMPSSIPVLLFGHVLTGFATRLSLGLLGLVSGAAGFGMLKLKPWAFYTELVIQCVFLVNAVLTIFSPTFVPVMRAAMQGMFDQNAAFPGGNLFLSDNYLRGSMIFGLVFCVALVALLLFQRSRFLEAAAEAAKA